MPNTDLKIDLSHLLDSGLPSDTIESLVVSSPSGSISADGVNAVVRTAARDLSNQILTSAASDLVKGLAVTMSPLNTATLLINYKYSQLGAASGFLGSPTSAVTGSTDGVGFYRVFNGGSIYWHPATGAHELHGPIQVKWNSLGAERGFLGYPTTDQTLGRDPQRRGAFNQFQGGAIYWHPEPLMSAVVTTAVNIGAVISQPNNTPAGSAAASTRVSTSPALSSPTVATGASSATRIANVPIGGAVETRFDPTTVVTVKPASSAGAHEVHGAILGKYLELGAEASILGYPTSDEIAPPSGNGRVSHFEAGDIFWTASTGPAEIHGLIRDFWLQHGSDQGAFGFPISDELIPDRRLGHVRPETKRKPVLNLPADVVKLPAGAATLGFPAAVVNASASRAVTTTVRTATVTASQPAPTSPAASILNSGMSDRTTIGSVVTGALGIINEASSPAPTRSENRFEDFESGVLFWQRGATAATQVSPWLQSTDGTKMHWTSAEIQAAAQPSLSQALTGLTGLSAGSAVYLGTTSYSYDGAGVHNRRHRFQLTLLGGLLGIVPMPVVIEIHVEVAFEPLERKIVAFIANWVPVLMPALNNDPMGQLHRRLDPALWSRFDLAQLPDTDNDNPIAVLAVKTLSNGDVNVYIEPKLSILGTVAVGGAIRTTDLIRDVANP